MATHQHTVQLLRKKHMVRTVFQISWSALAMCRRELAVDYAKLRVPTQDSNWMMAKAWVVKEGSVTAKINVLQNYYALAVRENLNDADEMAKNIEASLFHVASTNENPQHHLCPDGENS